MKLTKARIDRICQAIRDKNFVGTAAKMAGIGRTTFYEWREKGLAAREAGKTRSIYCQFVDALEEAEAEAEADLVEQVMKTKRGPLEILKRRYRSRWGDRIATELSGPDGRPLEDAASKSVIVNIIAEGGEEEPWKEIKEDDPDQVLPPTSDAPAVPLAPPAEPEAGQNEGW